MSLMPPLPDAVAGGALTDGPILLVPPQATRPQSSPKHSPPLTRPRWSPWVALPRCPTPPSSCGGGSGDCLYLVRCAELYLKKHGRFGMVLPETTLSRVQHNGFRAGSYGTIRWPLTRADTERRGGAVTTDAR